MAQCGQRDKGGQMRLRTQGLLVTALALVCVINIGLAIILATDSSYSSQNPDGGAFDILYGTVFAAVGSIIAIRKPSNLVGWSMLLAGGGGLLGDLLGSYAELSLLAEPELRLPLGLEAAALASGSWVFLMAGIFLLVLLFPFGRVPSRRWRPIARLVLLGFGLIFAGIATAPVGVDGVTFDPPFQDFNHNPLAFATFGTYFYAIFGVIAFCLAAIVAASIDLIVRFVRSRGDEREQYKWLAAAGALLALSIPFSGTAGFGILSSVADLTFRLALLGIPMAVGVAVMRYRLYDIDRILNQALVYSAVTTMLGLTYFILVVGLQEVLRTFSAGSDLALVLTTLVVAALFLPVRRRIQEAVDRRFNRQSYDAARTIEGFSSRLREQIDLDTLRYELLAVVHGTLRPDSASLWLKSPSPRRSID
jgi:hypothetical protein